MVAAHVLTVLVHHAQIDFDEFCQIAEKSEGGAFARLIRKVKDDEQVRVWMSERLRPRREFRPLEEQLQKIREQRVWMSGLHMTTVQGMVACAKAGYHGENTIYRGQGAPTQAVAAPPKRVLAEVPDHRDLSSPVTVTDKLALSPMRTARPMLPVSNRADLNQPSPTRRAFEQGKREGYPAIISGRSVSTHSPRRAILPAVSRGMHAVSPRSHSHPTRRPPLHSAEVRMGGAARREPSFHEANASAALLTHA